MACQLLSSTDFARRVVVTARLIIFAGTRTSCQDRRAPANIPRASSGRLEQCQCKGDVTIRNNCPRTDGLIKSKLFRAVYSHETRHRAISKCTRFVASSSGAATLLACLLDCDYFVANLRLRRPKKYRKLRYWISLVFDLYGLFTVFKLDDSVARQCYRVARANRTRANRTNPLSFTA